MMAVYRLISVLHLTIARIVNGLALICDILKAGLHSTGTIIKEIPMTIDSLLAVLYLAIARIVNGLTLISNPL